MSRRTYKGDPITYSQTVRRYKDGDYNVWKDSRGKVHRRKKGVRNYTDAGAPMRNSKRRMKGFANTTDASRMVQHPK